MSGRIGAAAEDAGIHFFDVRPTFDGHEVCGSEGEWINGVSLPVVHSFHPNVDGQVGWANAIRTYFDDLVAVGAPLNDAGFPLNPQPGVPFARTALAAPELAEGDPSITRTSTSDEGGGGRGGRRGCPGDGRRRMWRRWHE